MSDDTDTITPEPIEAPHDDVPEPPSLPELNHRFAQLVAFESAVKEYVARERAAMTGQYLAAYRAMGAKTFDAKGDDGTVLAQFTLKENKATHDTIVVGNPEQLLAFVLDNHPTEVAMNPTVQPAFEAALLARVIYEPGEDGEPGQIIDPTTGLVVEGLKHVPGQPAAEPTTFGTYWKTGGKEAVLEELRDVAIGEVLALPQAG
jgi:hypothetical protein